MTPKETLGIVGVKVEGNTKTAMIESSEFYHLEVEYCTDPHTIRVSAEDVDGRYDLKDVWKWATEVKPDLEDHVADVVRWLACPVCHTHGFQSHNCFNCGA